MSSDRPFMGFGLVTFGHQAQTLRSLAAFNSVYSNPPIIWHHDFRQSAFDLSHIPKNVIPCRETFQTGWGTLGTVRAMTACLRQLVEAENAPEWVSLITSSCYPIKSFQIVQQALSDPAIDAYVRAEQIFPVDQPTPFQQERVLRYVAPYKRIPRPTRRLGIKWLYLPSHARIEKHERFGDNLPCFAGSTYFTARAEAVRKMLAWIDHHPWVWEYFRHRPIVDECLFQTAFHNCGGLNIKNDDLRYIHWVDLEKFPGASNPKVLGLEDMEAISNSSAIIARKFFVEMDPKVMDEIDLWLG